MTLLLLVRQEGAKQIILNDNSMKAKVKNGHHLVFMPERGFEFENTLIINLNERWTYLSFLQKKNHLLIKTTEGEIDIVFTSETPNLKFNYQEKEQIVFNVLTK